MLSLNHLKADSSDPLYTCLNTRQILVLLMFLLFGGSVQAQELIHYDLSLESLGGVHVGERLDQIEARIGKTKSMTNPMLDPQNQCEKRVLYYANDLEVELCSTKSRDSVHSLRVVKNEAVSTARGARTGMTLAQIKTIYPTSKTIGDHTILVQDLKTHLRLRFLFMNGKAYEISFYREKKEEIKKSRRSPSSKLMDF